MSTESLLNKVSQLVTAQNELVNIISAKGIIVPQGTKIPDIPNLARNIQNVPSKSEGSITLSQTSDTLTLVNLPQKPVEVGIISYDVRDASLLTSNTYNYAIVNLVAFFEAEDEDEIEVDGCIITRTQSQNGTWQLEFSFEAYNEENTETVKGFFGGYTYNWAIFYDTII